MSKEIKAIATRKMDDGRIMLTVVIDTKIVQVAVKKNVAVSIIKALADVLD